jgi:hypothetical protein
MVLPSFRLDTVHAKHKDTGFTSPFNFSANLWASFVDRTGHIVPNTASQCNAPSILVGLHAEGFYIATVQESMVEQPLSVGLCDLNPLGTASTASAA